MAFWSFVYLFFGSVVEYRVQTMRIYDHEFINGFDPNVHYGGAMVDLVVNVRTHGIGYISSDSSTATNANIW